VARSRGAVAPARRQRRPGLHASIPTGEKTTLSELLRGKEGHDHRFLFRGAVLAAPRRLSCQKLYAKLSEQGLQVLAIDQGDSPESVRVSPRNSS